jgi:hypothetical protein
MPEASLAGETASRFTEAETQRYLSEENAPKGESHERGEDEISLTRIRREETGKRVDKP